jgi:hypothetical protein
MHDEALPHRARIMLAAIGLIMFMGGIVMILADIKWGTVVAILGVTPVMVAIQNIEIWPFRRRRP